MEKTAPLREVLIQVLMPIGPILLLIVLVLLWAGFGADSLAALRLRPLAAFLLCLGALIGSAFARPLAPGLTMNIGAAALPLLLTLVFALTPARAADAAWTVVAAGVTGFALYQIGRIFPPNLPSELNFLSLDVQYLLAAAGGVAGCVTSRTARGAFAAATVGVALADVAHYLALRAAGSVPAPPIAVGGSGAMGTAAVAATLAVVLHTFVRQSVRMPAEREGRPVSLSPGESVGHSDRLT